MLLLYTLMLLFSLACPDDRSMYLQDYDKVLKAYQREKCLSYKVVYKSYDTSVSKPDTTLYGNYYLKGDFFRTKLAGTESIKNKDFYLSVDHINKVMFLTKSSSVTTTFYPTAIVDTALRKSSLTVYREKTSGQATVIYALKYANEEGPVRSIKLEIDTLRYLIKTLTLKVAPRENLYDAPVWKYLEEPFIRMEFLNYSTEYLDDSKFSVSTFIDVNNGHDATLKDPFKKYELVNSISLSKQFR